MKKPPMFAKESDLCTAFIAAVHRHGLPTPKRPDLRIQHPRVWAEIEADPEKWQRAHGVLL